MPRWPEDTRTRLIEAAFELFGDQGYASTTVRQIADRVGTTSRTFFRHFPDKEEVLFANDDDLLPLLVDAIIQTDDAADAGTMMLGVLRILADSMHPRRAQLLQRDSIIAQDVGLAGRELAKQARWQRTVAEALKRRGFSPPDADILAAVGFALFTSALREWLSGTEADLQVSLERKFLHLTIALTQPVPSSEKRY